VADATADDAALMSTLFEAAGFGKDAPRPLADRLRPQKLNDVVGQDHLTGDDGILSRMLASGRIPSIILWGPPGTGKTTIARLLAGETGLAFEQMSAIFSGVADLKKAFEQARIRREQGRGTLLFVDENSPFQQIATGFVFTLCGGWHDYACGGHDRKPLL
jgi:putative ATPase